MKYFAILSLLFCASAQATENLPLTCEAYPDCSHSQRVFDVPAADTMVSTPTGWQRFDAVTGTVLVCLDDLAPGASTNDCPPDRKVQVPRDEVYALPDDDPGIPLGTATLTWQAPTKNTDGSSLTDLSGYIIRYGLASGNLTSQIEINDSAVSTYIVELFNPGKWYFSLAAVNAKNAESAQSPEVTKTIAAVTLPTIAMSCSPADGVESVTPTCAWSTSGATGCAAEGDWSGVKPLSGTETLPAITGNANLTLSCSGPGGAATITVPIVISPRPAAPTLSVE